jgi:hypothetical protein
MLNFGLFFYVIKMSDDKNKQCKEFGDYLATKLTINNQLAEQLLLEGVNEKVGEKLFVSMYDNLKTYYCATYWDVPEKYQSFIAHETNKTIKLIKHNSFQKILDKYERAGILFEIPTIDELMEEAETYKNRMFYNTLPESNKEVKKHKNSFE